MNTVLMSVSSQLASEGNVIGQAKQVAVSHLFPFKEADKDGSGGPGSSKRSQEGARKSPGLTHFRQRNK